MCAPPVYCMPYIYTHSCTCRHLTAETAQICFCLWVSVSSNHWPFCGSSNLQGGFYDGPQIKFAENIFRALLDRYTGNRARRHAQVLCSLQCTVRSCLCSSVRSCLAPVTVHLCLGPSRSWLQMWDESCNSCCSWLSCISTPTPPPPPFLSHFRSFFFFNSFFSRPPN